MDVPEPSGDLLGASDFVPAAVPQGAATPHGAVDDVFGFRNSGSGTAVAVPAGQGVAGSHFEPQSQVGDGFDDDFFSGGAAGAAEAAATQPGVTVGGSTADWLPQLGGGGPSTSAGPRAGPAQVGRSSSRTSAGPQQGAEVQESGDVLLKQAIANAQQACMSLSQDRVGRVQGAIAQAHEYVADKVVSSISVCLPAFRF